MLFGGTENKRRNCLFRIGKALRDNEAIGIKRRERLCLVILFINMKILKSGSLLFMEQAEVVLSGNVKLKPSRKNSMYY